LQLAGVTRQVPNPVPGIMRDPKTGEPTGVIKEDPADGIFERVIPLPTREEKLRGIRQSLKEANRVGLVRVHCAGNLGIGISDLENAELYDQLRRTGDLTLRIYMAYYMEPPSLTDRKLREIEEARRRYHDQWIAAGVAKFFLDGVIESHTAAMLAPYSDDPSTSGQTLWDPDAYTKAVVELDRHGVQVFTHAIGDRAIRLALDAYETAQEANHNHDARARIEHIEDAAAADLPRFGKLGVAASFQPLHAYPDVDVLKIWSGN